MGIREIEKARWSVYSDGVSSSRLVATCLTMDRHLEFEFKS